MGADNRRAERQMQDADRAAADAAELQFHAEDTFLNETAPTHLACGRVRRDAYKGSTRAERIQVKEQLQAQAVENGDRRFAEKCDDHIFNNQTEQTRRQLVAMEREKQR